MGMIAVNKSIIERIKLYNAFDTPTSDVVVHTSTPIENELLGEIHKIISDTDPDAINIDLMDIEAVLDATGSALIGMAETSGADRALKAIEQAALLTSEQKQAFANSRLAIMSIASGEEAALEMEELSSITEYLEEKLGDEAEIIFGYGEDEHLGDKMRVLLIVSIK
jgi:cell division GTPase FtsZ